MKAILLFSAFCAFLFASNATVIRNKKSPQVDAVDAQPCSSNASVAWLDVILIIDTSMHMGAANLKKISSAATLALSKFTIGSNDDISSGSFNTRVAVMTYNYQGAFQALFTDITSVNDLTTSLNAIKVSTSPYADLYDPVLRILEWTNSNDPPGTNGRPTVLVFFSASANAPVNMQVPDLIAQNFDPYSTTVITVNFNTADSNLTSLLAAITLNQFVNAPMYNLSGTSNSLTRDLEWSLLQANCFCGDGTGIPTILYDSANARYSRYASCMILDQAPGFVEGINDICSGDGFVMPAYILTQNKEKFIEGIWNDCGDGESCYPFYVGLHKNAKDAWAWYDWDLSEFPPTGYFDWGQGYPVKDSMSNCTVVDSNDGVNFIWRNTPCNTQYSLVVNILCQSHSCDAENSDCINTSYNYDDDQPKGYKKPIKKGTDTGARKRMLTKIKKSKNGKKNVMKNKLPLKA